MNYLRQGIHPQRRNMRSMDDIDESDYVICSYPPNPYNYYYKYLRVLKKTKKRITVMDGIDRNFLYWDARNNCLFSKKHNKTICYFLKDINLNIDECDTLP